MLGRFYSGFSHKSMALSVLGSRQSPVRWAYNVWCVISGTVFCVAPYVMYHRYQNGLVTAIWILLAVYGIGCEIISGFCPLNENRQDEDAVTRVHGFGSAIGFMTLLFSPLLMAILQFQTDGLLAGFVSLICFIISFVFFCFFIMGEKEKFSNTVLRHSGIWQRLVLAFCYVPIFAWCLYIM